MTSTFLSTGYNVTPNGLGSFRSDVTNHDLTPDTALTLFLFLSIFYP